ncbi:hypothetical protein [Aestuariispira insulae]|uniref:hypothetical protein n=1 Tax=Aestuariispira insulae TaxID=1461337 RepID=UPI0011C03E7B|nr:hypothetical protein [Aestuariispira insulae]
MAKNHLFSKETGALSDPDDCMDVVPALLRAIETSSCLLPDIFAAAQENARARPFHRARVEAVPLTAFQPAYEKAEIATIVTNICYSAYLAGIVEETEIIAEALIILFPASPIGYMLTALLLIEAGSIQHAIAFLEASGEPTLHDSPLLAQIYLLAIKHSEDALADPGDRGIATANDNLAIAVRTYVEESFIFSRLDHPSMDHLSIDRGLAGD